MFADDGAYISPAAFSDFDGNDSVVQEDGKVVVVGDSSQFGGALQLVRYNADGTLDTTFGDGGRVISTPQNLRGTLGGVALQDDGKIVVAGSLGAGFQTRFMVARFNTDGTLDTSFGEDGFNNTAVDAFSSTARDLVILPDGKILAGGDSNGEEELAVVRYNSDGTVDSSFGTDGVTLTDVAGVREDDQGHAIAVQADGKILLGGASDTDNGTFFGGGFEFALLRYDANGLLDTTFGDDGIVLTEFDSTPDNFQGDFLREIIVQPDGRIIAVGSSDGEDALAIARYNTDGSLDSTFGTDGLVTSDLGQDEEVDAEGALLLDSGEIIVVGSLDAENFIARFESDGSLDSTFGTNSGYTPIAHNEIVGNFLPVFTSVSMADGFFTAGRDFSVTKFDEDGMLDFSTPGQGELPLTLSQTSVPAPDGKILVGGAAGTSLSDGFITRLNADGSPDNSFGADSVITFTDRQSAIEALAVRPDGRIVALGDGGQDFLVYQLNADGSPDTTFGTDGLTVVDFAPFDGPQAIALQPDGKVVVAGENGSDFAIARLDEDGSLDTTFGDAGLVTLDLGGRFDEVQSLFVLPDGRILAAGQGGALPNATVARFNPDGTLDQTFGIDGVATANIGGSNFARAARLLPDGKILIAATSIGLGNDFGLAQFNAAGSLDDTFGTNGIARVDLGGAAPDNDDNIQGVEVLGDGRIAVFGSSDAIADGDFVMAVLNADGSLDSSFGVEGSRGVEVSSLAGFGLTAGSHIQDGNIVLIGSTVIGGDLRATAVRIFGADSGAPGDDPVISISDASIVELDSGEQSLEFTVTRSANDVATAVDWNTTDGTAIAGEDYEQASGRITFPAGGPLTQTVRVTILSDEIVELDESFSVQLSNASGGVIGDDTASGTIENDDSATIRINNASQNEGDSGTVEFLFEISIDAEVDEAVTFNATTEDGTATAASGDYGAEDQDLTIRTPETNVTFSVVVGGDTEVEGDETFFVNLSGLSTNGRDVTFADDRGVGTIRDDDDDDDDVPPMGEHDCSGNPSRGVYLLDDGTLFIVGTNNNDTLHTFETSSEIRVTRNGVRTTWDRDGIEQIVICGDRGRDLIDRDGPDNTLPSFIDGGRGPDSLHAGKGPDEVIGGGGDDLLAGNEGNDTLKGGAGNDGLDGEDGDDFLNGGSGADRLRGRAGDDTLKGSSGADQLFGHQGNDLLQGGNGHDALDGGTGSDVLEGGDGNDALEGDRGRDILIGGRDGDALRGDGGDDILIGGTVDLSETELFAVRDEWNASRARGRALRISNIRGTGSGERENGDAFLNSTTINDDAFEDRLHGEGGTDWFFSSALDNLRDRRLRIEELDLI